MNMSMSSLEIKNNLLKKYLQNIYIMESEFENRIIELVDIDSLSNLELVFTTKIILKINQIQ